MNCIKNEIKGGMTIAAIKSEEYQDYKSKYDFVIGNDLFGKHASLDLLMKVFEKLLKVGGKGIIIYSPIQMNQGN